MYIAATSIICPVGLSPQAACAAMRAGIPAFKELPYCDNQGEPIFGAFVPGFNEFPRQGPQLVDMLTQALSDLVKSNSTIDFRRMPLLVGLAEPDRPGADASLAGSIIAKLQDALGVQFHPQHSRTYASGHTACFEALANARELLQDSYVPACVVCSVDSFLNARTLLWLDRDFRLKTPANRDGVIPGEAAAAVLLQLTAPAKTAAEVAGLGFGDEQAHILSEEPLLGLGLTDALRTALAEASVGMHQIDCRISDVTGELYGFKELPLVEGRLTRVVRKQEQPLWHWAEMIGDTGAAAGVLQLIAAADAFQHGYAPGALTACMTSAVQGKRAATVLRRAVQGMAIAS